MPRWISFSWGKYFAFIEQGDWFYLDNSSLALGWQQKGQALHMLNNIPQWYKHTDTFWGCYYLFLFQIGTFSLLKTFLKFLSFSIMILLVNANIETKMSWNFNNVYKRHKYIPSAYKSFPKKKERNQLIKAYNFLRILVLLYF